MVIANDDILKDFLVEAGEILEQLSEQLVELERSPADRELLNAIFRGFHTVKGGAGFLGLDALVDTCHATETLFDLLRKEQCRVTTPLMDVVLRAFDTVSTQFAAVAGGGVPDAAAPQLLRDLEQCATPALEEPATAAINLTEAEYAGLVESVADSGDTITEDEFDALLDQLQGRKSAPSQPLAAAPASTKPAQNKPAQTTPASKTPASKTPEAISDVEFEALLDQLHGAGRGPTVAAAGQAAPRAQVESAPAPAVAEAQAVGAKPSAKARDNQETSVRVDTQRLDDIMNMVGELVLVRNRLVRLGRSSTDAALAQAVTNLDVVTADLQTAVMKTRMQPIKKVFGRFPRVVRDLARLLGKEIDLELKGEDTDLDKNLVDALADPLVHLVRNSVDHGIESPAVRLSLGKPKAGKIVLAAEQAGDHILLTVTDDGAGMDPVKLRSKAVEKGLMDADSAARLSDAEAFNLIFAPGFSTKTEISDVSGRGVGMDVVKTKISQLNGAIEIRSAPGQGTTLLIRVPLTLAIMPTLMVVVAGQCFALPLAAVNEIFQLDLAATHVVDGQTCITIRNRALPMFYLSRWLNRNGVARQCDSSAHVVIVSVGLQRVAFVVDQLIGQEEVVIKPLGRMLQGTPGIAGATITGDGTMALILDVPVLLKHYARRG